MTKVILISRCNSKQLEGRKRPFHIFASFRKSIFTSRNSQKYMHLVLTTSEVLQLPLECLKLCKSRKYLERSLKSQWVKSQLEVLPQWVSQHIKETFNFPSLLPRIMLECNHQCLGVTENAWITLEELKNRFGVAFNSDILNCVSIKVNSLQ